MFQDVWYGFFVNVYDNESTHRAIEKSDMSPSLDARAYLPAEISQRNFIVQPDDNTVNTDSEWTFTLTPGIAMMQECYIKLTFPPELEILWDSIEALGIFLPRNL